MDIFLIGIISYLMGSIPFGFILTKIFLKKELLKICEKYRYSDSNIVLTNTRHLNELNQCLSEINLILENINNVSSDLITINIRKALNHLGNITGEITTDDLLGNIFINFCIGK